MKNKTLLFFALLAGIIGLSTSIVIAAPGDQIISVNLPVGGFGVSVAVDCNGNVFYTIGDNKLYKMDKNGILLDTIPTVDVTGQSVNIDEFAWDEGRGVLWAQEHGSNPVDVYWLDPDTGIATFKWQSVTNSIGSYRDGLAYDGNDDTIWISGDVSSTIEHYQADGTFINSITPKTAAGGTLGTISGIMVGVGDLLYLGRNGLTQIVKVKKSNGDFISSFSSPGGTRDEGLECDSVNFPVLAIWSRDVNNFMSVIEVEPGTCSCGAQEAFCGDGNVDPPGEECDDGNNIDGDGCNSNCKKEELTFAEEINFTAVPENGKVTLMWTAISEEDVLGYNVMRTSNSGPTAVDQVNADLIPAKGSIETTVDYELVDDNVQNRITYTYQLIEVQTDGQTKFHGPESATPRLIYLDILK